MLGEIGDEVIITSLVKTGVGKEMCDDAVFDGNKIITHDDSTINRKDSNSWIAIADGVGGNAGGHEASTFLLEYIHENYVSNDKKTDLYAMLKEANEQLIAYAQEISGKENMATTFTGIFFEIGEVKIAHSGNTRVYALQQFSHLFQSEPYGFVLHVNTYFSQTIFSLINNDFSIFTHVVIPLF